MKRGVVLLAVLHGVNESGILEERAVLYSLGYAHELLIHNAARAYIGVADLAVAHLSVGQTDIETRCADICHRIFREYSVEIRLLRRGDSVAVGVGILAEAVHDAKKHRLFTHFNFPFNYRRFGM